MKRERILSIQLNPEKAPGINVAEFLQRFEDYTGETEYITSYCIEQGKDHGAYINILFKSDDVKKLWAEIKSRFYGIQQQGQLLSAATVVTCQGSRGWDDYLLLHSSDRGEKLDSLD